MQVDGYLMVIITVLLLFLFYRGIQSWLRKPAVLRRGLRFELNEEIEEHPAVDLLKSAGYEVISGKLKVPLTFKVNRMELHSRLFIDYVAVQGEELFLVRLERPRQPVDWTGSGVRRELLPFLLLYPDCSGLLYIDADYSEIKVIVLDSDDE
ncbi:hypothetical protein [Paenibacillus sp. J22TS3]|uniref:hypothetical protein n=1 Tax=Paenibacillus sp. J22TS3 TaxID=2807192 RepID=UPI001B09BC4F|nr:hypothetical protein [Paenibacillus sp. J22TS3]GIP20203.1 hypothetical protein J22TS3_04780 [Paenibacillus sp. J22TS3]